VNVFQDHVQHLVDLYIGMIGDNFDLPVNAELLVFGVVHLEEPVRVQQKAVASRERTLKVSYCSFSSMPRGVPTYKNRFAEINGLHKGISVLPIEGGVGDQVCMRVHVSEGIAFFAFFIDRPVLCDTI